MGKLAEKLIALRLAEKGELWHPRSFAGRKGIGAIDSVLLIDKLRRETGLTTYRRDIHSAFDSP